MAATREIWYRLQSPPARASLNMAWDEALLEAAASFQQPVLRFYSWNEPAATFGYFQKYAQVAQLTHLRPLIRRPTGGGLVPHAADWTYSLTFPPDHPWHRLRARVIYHQLHEWMRAAFLALGLATELSAVGDESPSGECFAGPQEADLVVNHQKIAGAAQRRNRAGLLIQGSVQLLTAILPDAWQAAFCSHAERAWGVEWRSFPDSLSVAQRANQLDQDKYSQAGYNVRR